MTNFELFFDLVYVFAVTQISHLLLANLTGRGAVQSLIVLLAIWWAWIYTTWATNWLDPNRALVRLMLVGVMLGSLIMASAVPEAFGERGLLFAGAYAAIQVGRGAFVMYAVRGEDSLRRNFQRITFWCVASSVIWVAGGLTEGVNRELLWLLALVIDYAAPAFGYFTPGLSRSTTTDWTIQGSHMAERCQLFVILSLGESIIITGATFAGLPTTAMVFVALIAALFGSVAIWWVYFARGGDDAERVIAQADDPGRLGRAAYSYLHLPIVAGIIVIAVADELVLVHPLDNPGTSEIAAVLGGAVLFLLGHLLFKLVIFERVSLSRLAAIMVLLALVPFAGSVPLLGLGIATTVVIAAVAVWDGRFDPHHAANERD
ncbi:MAG: low temperature requirement protein A [Chloroflexota bacterium]|nr:low temperature requirement protein A [Chloroflexota bacterium]